MVVLIVLISTVSNLEGYGDLVRTGFNSFTFGTEWWS